MSLILITDVETQNMQGQVKQEVIKALHLSAQAMGNNETEPKAATGKDTPFPHAQLLLMEMHFNQWFFGLEESSQPIEEDRNDSLALVTTAKESVTTSDASNDYFVCHKQINIKKNNLKSEQYFYRAKTHNELYHVGRQYYADYKNGMTHFGFYGHGLRETREKTVFGLYAFFTHEIDTKITIFTSSLDRSFYSKVIEGLESEKRIIKGEDITFVVHRSNNLEIIEFSALEKVVREMQRYTIEDLLVAYFAKSSIVFWDLPEIDKMAMSKEIFFPIIRHIGNVSILIAANFSKAADFSNTLNYFKKCGTLLKGVLMKPDLSTRHIEVAYQ